MWLVCDWSCLVTHSRPQVKMRWQLTRPSCCGDLRVCVCARTCVCVRVCVSARVCFLLCICRSTNALCIIVSFKSPSYYITFRCAIFFSTDLFSFNKIQEWPISVWTMHNSEIIVVFKCEISNHRILRIPCLCLCGMIAMSLFSWVPFSCFHCIARLKGLLPVCC